MKLRDLQVLHWHVPHADSPAPELSGRDLFLIDTCQRRVGVLIGEPARAAAQRLFAADGAPQVFDGLDAYTFLLRFACGLESKLIAETEIFGQIKQAWRTFSARPTPLSRQLSPLMQQLFQDAKAVRAEYLCGLGSTSYGSQVRRLLGPASAAGPTLLLGAGQLARSLAPWLEGSPLWLWNRTAGRAVELQDEIVRRRPGRPVCIVEADPAAELAAWRAARDVVVCVPADAERDGQRIAAWRSRPERDGRIIHLGLAPGAEGAWAQLAQLVSLEAMFGMLREQGEQRQRQIERAQQACVEKALLRSLGAPTQPDSWEDQDLAAFQSL